MKPFRYAPLILIGVLLQSSSASAAKLNAAIEGIASRVQSYLTDKGESKIGVGDIVGPPSSSAGRTVKNMLNQELKKKGVDVAPLGAKWTVQGKFFTQVDEQQKEAKVRFKFELVDGNGAPLTDINDVLEDTVDNLSDVLGLTQPTAFDGESVAKSDPAKTTPSNSDPATTVPPKTEPPKVSSSGTPPKTGTTSSGDADLIKSALSKTQIVSAREEQLAKSIATGTFHQVSTTTISASSTSPYEVEIWVKKPGGNAFQPLPITQVDKFAFVDLQEGDEYAVVVRNKSSRDIGFELSIDGINSFALSEVPDLKATGKYAVLGTARNQGRAGGGIIKGWYRNQAQAFAFKVTSEPDAVAARLGRPGQIGTITATIFDAFTETEEPHGLELALSPGQGKGLGTGQGPAVENPSQTVARKFGQQPLAAISIRYVNPEQRPGDLPQDAP